MPNETPPGRRIRGLDADQRRQQRRQALLDAGLDLFAAQGFINTTIEQLCQHAYVGTKAFYETFESREQLYVELLKAIADGAFTRLGELDTSQPSGSEADVSERILAAFAHVFVDDVRAAKVTFGEGSAITPDAERQRRQNRRTAAAFVEGIWNRFSAAEKHQRHVAIGLIGGLFDIIADWVHDVAEQEPTDDEVDELILRLNAFYRAVRQEQLG